MKKDILSLSPSFASQELMEAVKENNCSRVEDLLKVDGINVNVRNDFGCTALMVAATAGYAAIVEKLIQAGADVHEKTDRG